MLREAMQFLVDLSEPSYHTDDDRLYCDKKLYPVVPKEIETITFNSLSSLCVFVNAHLSEEDYMFHVLNEKNVHVLSRVLDTWGRRELIASAHTDILPSSFDFDHFMTTDEFNIKLLTKFQISSGVTELLKFTRSMGAGKTLEVEDDGVSQTVQGKAGIAIKQAVKAPVKIQLMPYRTFRDINTQPSSEFLFRAKTRGDDLTPYVALFETDGGEWKIKAMQLISTYIQDKCKNFVVLN